MLLLLNKPEKIITPKYAENPPRPKTAAAAFTDVTLVEKDEQPPAAHRVILRAGRP